MPYVAAALVVGLVIVIHELGHLIAAKLCGIPVERFSIGFGPRIAGFRRGETSYWLAAIPFGGYVLPALDEQDFHHVAVRKQIAFALGGPVANVIAAYVGLVALGRFQLGLPMLESVAFGATQLVSGLGQLAHAIAALFAGSGQLSGIVGIVAAGGSRFGATAAGLVAFSISINLNLGILNLLPLPPLDGGRIVFALLARMYRPLLRLQAPVTLAGWVFMLGLMTYATIRDIGNVV
jgi:regulator of sigma E protease